MLHKALLRPLYLAARLYWRITKPVTVGVRLMLVQDQHVLLVRHTYQPYWFLVGGGVKRGETLEQAARREAQEEVGASLGKLHLLGVYTNFWEYKSDHTTVFVCEDFRLNGKSDNEIADCQFFHLDALPQDLAPGHKRRVQEYFTGDKSPHFGPW